MLFIFKEKQIIFNDLHRILQKILFTVHYQNFSHKMSSSKNVTPNLVERVPLATPPSTPVLRVKRRRSQSPAGALKVHLSAKKRKETSEDSIISTSNQKESPKKESAVFKFTATLDNTDHDSLKIALNKADRVVKTDPKLLKRIGANPKDEKPTDASEKRYR